MATGAGFRPVRWFVTMERSLDEPLARLPLPAGVRLARWSEELDGDVLDAYNDAFLDHFGFEPISLVAWRHRVPDKPGFLPGASVLALEGSRVVGFVLCNLFDGSSATPSAWLDLIGVREGWRKRGLASALILEAMVALREAGHARVWLGVDADNSTGAVSVYARQGFRTSRREVMYAKDL